MHSPVIPFQNIILMVLNALHIYMARVCVCLSICLISLSKFMFYLLLFTCFPLRKWKPVVAAANDGPHKYSVNGWKLNCFLSCRPNRQHFEAFIIDLYANYSCLSTQLIVDHLFSALFCLWWFVVFFTETNILEIGRLFCGVGETAMQFHYTPARV